MIWWGNCNSKKSVVRCLLSVDFSYLCTHFLKTQCHKDAKTQSALRLCDFMSRLSVMTKV